MGLNVYSFNSKFTSFVERTPVYRSFTDSTLDLDLDTLPFWMNFVSDFGATDQCIPRQCLFGIRTTKAQLSRHKKPGDEFATKFIKS